MADETKPPGQRRAPQKKMSAEAKAQLAEILKRPDVRVGGKIHIPSVEAITGMSYGQIYGFMRSDRYWHSQLAEVDAAKGVPAESDLVDSQQPVGVTISDAQFEEYKAMIRQSRKMLARDWQALGMTEEAGKRMEHYASIGSAPTSMVLRVAGGQLFSNAELLDRIIKADCERVLTGKLPKEEGADGEERDPNLVEREWRHTVFQGMKLQLEMFSHMHKAQAMMARVMAELRKMNGGSVPEAKGSYDVTAPAVSEREP